MKFNKGDFVRIKRELFGYEDLRDDVGVVVISSQLLTTVMFQHHDNPFTRDHTYDIVTNNLEFVRATQISSKRYTDYEKYELNKKYGNPFSIKDVIFNDPAVIVLWDDGTKTVVKCSENDIFDPEKGLAMAISKKALGNQGNYYNTFKKYLPEEEDIDDFGLHPFVSLGKAAARWADDYHDLIDNLKKQTSKTPEPIHPTVAYEEPYYCATCKYLCQPLESAPCFGCGVNKTKWEPIK